MKRTCFVRCCLILGVWLLYTPLLAQLEERVYQTAYQIDPTKEKQLFVELDNLSFFKNNEYAGTVMKGYSLPGLWVQPKAVYYPLSNIKLEAGLHMLFYHGAHKYPSMAYKDIPVWKGNQYQKGAHFLPFFRVQMRLSDRIDLIVGNIYGASNHRLIEPLYSPELNLTADPEAGVQLLYHSQSFDLDAWLNWESFIYREDTHQEAFTVGLSSRLKLNAPTSPYHFYIPIQGVAQHRGGEIDTLTVSSVQTLMNGALGVGGVWNTGHRVFKKLNVELDIAGYYQQAGEIWPFDSGYGLYAKAMADISDFRVKTAYWQCDEFISMFGVPFYGAVSTRENGATYQRPQMVYLGMEYSRSLGKGFSLGVDLDVYQTLSGKMHEPETGWKPINGSTSFSFGVYVRVNPSFLIKQF
ncbi:hypothetical protein [Parabacteroides sp. PF5-9]|uniref:hypothetical protein n=1 Tax=Parabacteroides sp. PF5-9 TaxID=1742404 RepID=UPI002475148B|nr:hypothetical protein [Parabacteroides sp. PF5-9]MDH6356500.1 hypothetical protein [Parabacteroides sp. PF5-9]